MEIGIFSKCIKDLITDLDRVGVPGLGTFIAEQVPSSFSDKGTTINPPTRTMYFEKGDVSDTDAAPLFDYVCRTMGVDGEQAEVELNWCLGRIHSELGTNLICTLPGLGAMKASTSGTYFFVIDDNLDISPDTSCLAPVCIKPDGIAEPEPAAQEPEAEYPATSEPAAAEPEASKTVAEEPTASEPVASESVVEEPATAETAAGPDASESVAEEPAAQEPASEEPTTQEPAAAEPETSELAAEYPAASESVAQEPAKKSRKGWKMALVIVGIIAAIVIIILTLNRLFPQQVEDFLYRILYTAEERSILGR